ncbi:hypothetical protein NBRC116592_20680 [Colwellia sp. KU-HH00111]|uniref:STAS domain-containing protein n=1 Tax=Colwellia sp. KU-HH00111 TaxID=3127652 RepID=UPI0031079A2C
MTESARRITIETNHDSNQLVGELTRHTIMQITKKELKQLVAKERSIVNLQQLTRIDTAGLAWLFYLFEHANHVNCQLTFSHFPAKLDKLIRLSGVAGFLPEQR